MSAHWIERLGVTLLLIAVSAFGFLYIDGRFADAAPEPLALATPLDANIPFVPAFVYPYLLYYLWLLLPAALLHMRIVFYRALAAFVLMQACAATIFLALPSRMLRPTITAQGLASDLVRAVYTLDQGWNIFPSLHVAHSVLIALLAWAYRRRAFPLVVAGTALISASTLLIKQHYIVDLPGGAALAWACFRITRPDAAALSAQTPVAGEGTGNVQPS